LPLATLGQGKKEFSSPSLELLYKS